MDNARIDIECAGVLNSVLSGMAKFELLSLNSSLQNDLITQVLFDGLKVPKLKWLEMRHNRFDSDLKTTMDTNALTALNYVIKNCKLD